MLRTYFHEQFYDMPVDVAQKYADAIREAILSGKSFDGDKKEGFFLSKNKGFDDKLYIGNIHRIEDHLYWNDEELADDDQIVNVVVIDGPVTRDGDGCSYGSKDLRDQILYANTFPQVVGHVFILNTPGGAASARIDFEQAIADCREKGKFTVAWVDGLCCSAGQLVASLCDRTVVMNGRHTMGCIGTMCAFWGVPNGTVDQDGYRYIELVSISSPDKNAEYREAVDGKTEKLQAELDKLGDEFRETVRQNRPLVKEEHLTGKTFDAQDVMGALVDEIGDFGRAVECVFELAEKKMQPARSLSSDPSPKGEGGEEQANLEGDMGAMGDMEVKKQETVTPKDNSIMIDKEKKVDEIQEVQAAEQENPTPEPSPKEEGSEEAPAAEEPANEETNPANEETSPTPDPDTKEEGSEEEQPSAEEPATEEAPAAEEPSVTPEPSTEGESNDEAHEAEEDPSAEATGTSDEIERITETLHNAEALVEEKDKEIVRLKADKETLNNLVAKNEETIKEQRGFIADRDKTIAGQKETIEKLTKQVADLKSEVKELAEKPTQMVDASAGVPADNGTGEAPRINKQRIRPGMSYKEIREAEKQKK